MGYNLGRFCTKWASRTIFVNWRPSPIILDQKKVPYWLNKAPKVDWKTKEEQDMLSCRGCNVRLSVRPQFEWPQNWNSHLLTAYQIKPDQNRSKQLITSMQCQRQLITGMQCKRQLITDMQCLWRLIDCMQCLWGLINCMQSSWQLIAGMQCLWQLLTLYCMHAVL